MYIFFSVKEITMDGCNHLSEAKHIKIAEGKRKKEYGVLTKI